jgi:hypothetical protein
MFLKQRNFMKSIMQEASSIRKAIEEGWIKAGRPHEFTIKILEEPQTNLMGLFTTRSAKIALFFDDFKKPHTPSLPSQPANKSFNQKPKEVSTERTHQSRQYPKKTESVHHTSPARESHHDIQKTPALWNEQMVQLAHTWLEQMLTHMKIASLPFTIEPQNFYLRITLTRPILNEADKEKHLLATLSTLLLETIKKQFKNSLRGHKIVLTHQK